MEAEDHHEDAVFLSPLPSITGGGSYAKKGLHQHNHHSINNNNNNHHHHHHLSDYADGRAGATAAGEPHPYEGNQAEHQNRFFFQNMFSSNAHLGEGQGHGQGHDYSVNPAYLAPPPHYDMGRRRSSNSSLDSFNSRRRGSFRSSSALRLSEEEEHMKAASLMTYLRGVSHALRHARKALRRVFQAVFVTRPCRPRLVCEAEVMEQVGWVVKDYIVSRLIARDLMSRKTGVTPSNWPQSRHVIAAGTALEALYPRTYSNVSRKLCLTMSSAKLVRSTLLAVLEVLFERSITWAKVVSMMAIAGLYAEECASQGHPDFVHEVVDAVLDFTGGHLLTWLVTQGGWDGFPLPEGSEGNRLSKFRLLLVSGAATTMLFLRYYLLNYYNSDQET